MFRALIFLCTVVTTNCWSWNDSGHRQIAYLVYDLLDESTRTSIIELIQQHPRYREDFVAARPKNFDRWSEREQQRWIFSQISAWPDVVRSIKDENERNKFNRPQWHYINFPIIPNAEMEKALHSKIVENLSSNTSILENNRNIVQVLNYINQNFNEADAPNRTLQLCWLFHLVGDIHQPLHSSTLYTSKKLPHGDRGGGLINIGESNLHRVWDAAAGTSSKPRELQSRAEHIQASATLSQAGKSALQNLKIETWLQESRDLALSAVYGTATNQRGTILEQAIIFDAARIETFEVSLNDDYRYNMENVAEKRIIEAAYRLAELLKTDRYFGKR